MRTSGLNGQADPLLHFQLKQSSGLECSRDRVVQAQSAHPVHIRDDAHSVRGECYPDD